MYDHHEGFDDHALITSRRDTASGLSALIAIHNDTLGPAIGGCRILPYPTLDAAVTDVLRLSRGMTYKTAIAGIPYGGGKAVIIADPKSQKTRELLHAFGDFVESLGGRYITSFDSGTTLDDVRTIAERTASAAGILPGAGNASSSTARGLFYCMEVAAETLTGLPSLEGVRVAIQGVGNVGSRLVDMLVSAGAEVAVADRDAQRAAELAVRQGVHHLPADEIVGADVDIFAPCALGGVLTHEVIQELKARAVVGGANNQLVDIECDKSLTAAGILYCPDYLANAGGIIDLHYQRTTWSPEAVDAHLHTLANTFRAVIGRARAEERGTADVADQIARERFAGNGGAA